MHIEFLSTVAVIASDPAASRRLYVEALGLPLEGAGDDYHHTDQIAGSKSLRCLAAIPGRRGVLRSRRAANRLTHPAGKHRVRRRGRGRGGSQRRRSSSSSATNCFFDPCGRRGSDGGADSSRLRERSSGSRTRLCSTTTTDSRTRPALLTRRASRTLRHRVSEMRGFRASAVGSGVPAGSGAASAPLAAHWGSEPSASDVLVVNTMQDCSGSSNPAEHGHDRDRETAPLRLDRKCGLGVSFDLMIGRLALGHETAAPVLAAFLPER